MPHSKRLNPITGKRFKAGFVREDGMVFDGYQTSILRKNTGFCKEIWRSREGFDKAVEDDKKRKKHLYNKIKNIINDYKLSKGCEKCGYKDSPFALDFHHKDPKTKDKNVSFWFKTSYKQLKKIKKEWKKCMVLCANCHRVEHHGLDYARN